MATRTISITEEAYERLKALKKDEKTSFSDVIVRYYPVRRKLADVLAEIGECSELPARLRRFPEICGRAGCGRLKSDASCRSPTRRSSWT